MDARVVILTELQLKALVADAVSAAFKYYQPQPSTIQEANPFGDFKWLTATCAGMPPSTLRIKSAAGEIPGVVKFGKRVLYDKAAVMDYLRSQTRKAVSDSSELDQKAEAQINHQLGKKGGLNA